MHIIYDYKTISEILVADNLTFIENLALLTLFTKKVKRSEDPNNLPNICMTGKKNLDGKLIENFKKNKLFMETSNPPNIRKDKNSNYHEIDNIIEKSYISLIKREPDLEEIQEIKKAVTLIQADKLDALALHISKTYEIPIESSKKSLALLHDICSEYSLNDLLPLFHWEARKTKKYIKKERPKSYISRKLFFNNIAKRIEKEKHLGLRNYWKLPSTTQASPFEVLFCSIYLDDQVNWNSLSSNDIISNLLKNQLF